MGVEIKQTSLKPTVVMPATTPLILLAAADVLHVLTDLGRVVIVDVVALEAIYYREKPYAGQIAAWIEVGQAAGSNAPIEIAASELGPLYRLALQQNVKKPRHLGEIAMVEWLVDHLERLGGPALVIYEDSKVPLMLARQAMAAEVAATTTRNILTLAEEEGYIGSAAAVWTKVIEAVPTANPASVFTIVKPVTP